VRGNLEFGLKAQGLPKPEREGRIAEMLALVQMVPYTDSRPAELSGGQQQRVALARALILRPKALLMDEPLSSLDEDLNLRLRKEILRIQESMGLTLLYVTHDREEAFGIGTRVVIMSHGNIETSGSPEEIQAYYKTR
jgi:ABC-type Fe3+/spermidine/putrescine transport system ATPase subunit